MGVSGFGQLPDGRPVHRVTLGSAPGLVLEVLDLGATVHGLEVACGDGRRRGVVLGQASVDDYLASGDYLGGTIGRHANRIARGRFVLDGTEVQVGTHDRGNHLHGGPDGFDRRLWELVDHSDTDARFGLHSPAGDQGFPGNLTVEVTYTVTADAVRIAFTATTDAPTVVNLTNHAYLNLDGPGAGTIDDHELTVLAEEYTPVDETGIPLGDHAPVEGTPFDLRIPTVLGPVLRSDDEQLRRCRGIDHNFVLSGSGLRPVARLASRRTRTTLELSTDQPGLQVYTGNFLDGSTPGAGGLRFRQGDGIALEPQLFPDSPNHPEWPSPVLRPGEVYGARMGWVFGALE